MKNKFKFISFFLVLGLFATSAFASVNRVTSQMSFQPSQVIGEQAYNAQAYVNPSYAQILSGSGKDITGVQVTTAGTAEFVGLFDSQPIIYTSPIAYDVPAEAVFYAYVAANSNTLFDFSKAPLQTKNGVYLVVFNGQLSSATTRESVGSVIVYGEGQGN